MKLSLIRHANTNSLTHVSHSPIPPSHTPTRIIYAPPHTGSYLDCAIRDGLVKAIYRHILLVSDDIAALFDMIDDYTPPPGYVTWKKAE